MKNKITKADNVSAGIGITSSYNPNKCVASFKNTNIYTDEEIQENNKNCACDWF